MTRFRSPFFPTSAACLLSLAGILAGILACASSTAGSGGAAPAHTPETVIATPPRLPWPVKTRENVDLWLHGFALLDDDSAPGVPLFARGYRDEMVVLKNKANILTQLDVNHDRLREGVMGNRLLINAQFVPFYFSSVEDMRSTIDRFVAANGSPQSARSPEEATAFGVLATYFNSAQSRAWLALFASSLWDEDTKFYHSYWSQQQRERINVIDSTQSMWQKFVRPRINRVLQNTGQRDGDLILSLPLGGEGRTLSGSGVTRNAVAVPFPSRPADVPQAMYVALHELSGAIVNPVIIDNTTPAQQRTGEADRMVPAATVRAGMMLVEKMLPELADGYARYYLTAAGRTPGANPRAELIAAFPIPDVIRAGIAHQIDSVQGGI